MTVPTVTRRDNKALPKRSQQKNRAVPKYPGLWERTVEALETDTLRGIAGRLGLNDSSVWQWKHFGQPPSIDNLLKIAQLGNTSIEWLLTGSHPGVVIAGLDFKPSGLEEISVYFGEAEHRIIEKLARESGSEKETQVRELVLESLKARGLIADKVEGATLLFFGEHIPKLIPVKLLGLIAAGSPIEAIEQEGAVEVPETFIMPGRGSFVLKVAGDSMEDEGILDGDLIICYESSEAFNGQKVVALIDESEATVKKFYKEGNRIRLEPANAHYRPMIFDPDRVRILGVVVGIYRPM